MKHLFLTLTICPAVVLAGCAGPSPAAVHETNPFFEEWTTPFGSPPFDRIAERHFLPAFERAFAENRDEVAAIVHGQDPPTFANTIEALDRSGLLLAKVSGVFDTLTGSDTNDRIQEIAREIAPKRSQLRDDILMNADLFRRIEAVYEQRGDLRLDAEQQRLLEETHRDFVRGGATLAQDQKERMREINSRLASLALRFGDNLLAETNAYRLVIDSREDLAGLPPNVVTAAAEAAAEAGEQGTWLFTLHSPSIWPFLTYADNRELRRQILTAYTSRGANGNAHDNTEVLTEIAALRAERARLLGYRTHADFVLEERMAKTPTEVYDLLDELWKPSLERAHEEARTLQDWIDEDGHDFKLEPWDWRYYTEKVRRARYDVDEQEVRTYFELVNVIDGAFYVANRLYGITFTERKDIPTYHPDMRTYEVTDVDGGHLGVFMVDYHPRPSKGGGAWSGEIRGQWVDRGRDIRPVVFNVGNFSRPVGDTPALLSLEEVETLFHELGHGLHSLFARCQYRKSDRVARDFVELPSQIMENWVLEPEVLNVYARHYRTGEVIPDELIAKLRAAKKFNQGFTMVEYLAASYLDMDWHTLEHPVEVEPHEFEQRSLKAIHLMPEIVTRYRSPYFAHVFSASYSAGYYSYIWSEVLDADAFQSFKENGLFDHATAASFRTNILARVGSEDPEVLWERFRGGEPSVGPLLERRGFE
jgi:peptidyl-dipeptidase Dcp